MQIMNLHNYKIIIIQKKFIEWGTMQRRMGPSLLRVAREGLRGEIYTET